jgi:hypothetical protein
LEIARFITKSKKVFRLELFSKSVPKRTPLLIMQNGPFLVSFLVLFHDPT